MDLKTFLAGALFVMAWVVPLLGAEPGESVVVIYNKRLPESKDVADHYVAQREVPAAQVLGFDLTTNETMSRAEYREKLQAPLLSFLETNLLFIYPPLTNSSQQTNVPPVKAKVRYAVLCYGVPLRIAEDYGLADPGADKVPELLRRNGACVDSELATLPVKNQTVPLAGVAPNNLFGRLNEHLLDPTNGILMVARLDGPSAAIARALVDKAMQAERDGLWGRAYFDLQGLTSGDYKKGDDEIKAAAELAHEAGYETVVDDKPQTFSVAFPMSQIALYAGWYDGKVSGPFTRPHVEFMPGAFAYHLHSFSAQTIRSATERWCGPLLADGATATMGCIDEPYLDGTPDMHVFFACWLRGTFSFGEAAYACQRVLSWQTTVIGDPLYRPFGKTPRERHDALAERHSKLIEWSILQFVDEGLVMGATPAQMLPYLLPPDAPADSAVLLEKRAELEYKEGFHDSSIKSLGEALKFDPSPQQRVRLTLALSDQLVAAGRDQEALALCDDFLNQNPDYPDAVGLYTKMKELATKLHQTRQAAQYARQIAKHSAHN